MQAITEGLGSKKLYPAPTVADPYLFQVARGAAELGFQLPEPLRDYIARMHLAAK
jgi:hypothetical protein